MRFLLLALLCSTWLAAAPAEGLAAIKQQFPPHVNGPVTAKTDPLVAECFARYKAIVDKMTDATLQADLSSMRKQLEYDIRHYEAQLERAKEPTNSQSSRQKVLTASMRSAISANNAWLKMKLRPYLARLETYQRGRAGK